MRSRAWGPPICDTVAVGLSGRDLGAHISFGAISHSMTIEQRCVEAKQVAHRLNAIPTHLEQKARAAT
eukprot:10567527-Alexandrium_andersonii.AAC.1